MPDLNTNSIDSFYYGINVLPLLKFWYHLLIFCFKPEGLYLLWNTKEEILEKKITKKLCPYNDVQWGPEQHFNF